MALVAGYDDEDLALGLLALVGVYVVFNTWRNTLAGDAGGANFSTAAPTGAGDVLNILSPLQISPAGQAFIKQNEGWTATAEGDAGGQAIGYGHRIQPGENIISPITRQEGEQLFQDDIATAENAINQNVTVELTQNQFDALGDLAFNIGSAAFAGSTMVRLLNQGDYSGAAAQFASWNKSQGRVNSDLVARRSADASRFIS